MDPLTNDSVYISRSERNSQKKSERRRFRKIIWISIFILFLLGGGFLYSTNQGLQFRKMLVGTVLSSQHPQYVKYMGFLLPQSEIKALYEAMKHPPTIQTTVSPQMFPHSKKDETIKVDTVETPNYTAKIMIISDPTTVHLVESRFTESGQGLSDLIKENNGVAGINAGGFVDKGGTGSGGKVIGIVMSNGHLLSVPSEGKDAPELVGGFLKDGQFITGKYSVNQLLNMGVTEAVSFGPQLIVNSENRVTPSIDGAWGWAPRTAIGQEKNGSVVMIITDGRFYWNKTHRGASMSDMAHLFETYHVTNAIAMDGGGSTTMIKDGQLLLKPATSTRIGMRYLPNAWVVIPK
jgi:exopolysaccharide biosynthesis protein